MSRVIICGGRDFNNQAAAFIALDQIHAETPITHVGHGDAKGADFIGFLWAEANKISWRCFVAEWDTKGRSAGPMRNARMLAETKPDFVIAFPGGVGTAHMCDITTRAGIEVKYIDLPKNPGGVLVKREYMRAELARTGVNSKLEAGSLFFSQQQRRKRAQ